MESKSSVKTREKCVSPKTPGGISKSLLTPCRRVGLSRNWKNKGSSPFISPLSSHFSTKTDEIENVVKPSRKRKVCKQFETELKNNVKDVHDNILDNGDEISCTSTLASDDNDLRNTPRNTDLPRKRSKILDVSNSENIDKNAMAKIDTCEKNKNVNVEIKTSKIAKLTRTKSSKKIKTTTSPVQCVENNKDNIIKQGINKPEEINDITEEIATEAKRQSPNNLTKECIVVIQKKIFSCEENEDKNPKLSESNAKPGKNSQEMFDSDSDEVPLSKLNESELKLSRNDINKVILGDEDDFAQKLNVKIDKKTSNGDVKVNKSVDRVTKEIKNIRSSKKIIKTSQDSNSLDDDDDFELDKRTILIKKSYDKIPKLQKAKSTGSITQKDIELLKTRIEEKKRMLLAKTLTKDTEELRNLIKKWQKGCQDALMELMDLMKLKFPEKQNMEHSEILKMLKIPPNLVGYDSDNDCFDTPDDASIILAKFNK